MCKDSAFTLTEVLVSLLVFSIGLLGLVRMQILGFHSIQTALYRSQALSVASSIAAHIHAEQYAFNLNNIEDLMRFCRANLPRCKISLNYSLGNYAIKINWQAAFSSQVSEVLLVVKV
jgi:prepilin-type N-terminal cleavage/methylation domain-containing protein